MNSNLSKNFVLNNEYLVKKTIGQGGFGITYLVNSLINSQEFVVKELFIEGYTSRGINGIVAPFNIAKNEYEEYKKKFIEEAKLLQKLKGNPFTIDIIDIFKDNNTIYLVMPYISEFNLLQYVKKQTNGALTEEEALFYIQQIAKGLSLSHQQNILHLDIKPANILWSKDNKPILIDFGSAKEFILGNIGQKTKVSMYSEGYSPIELYSANGARGCFTDIYGLGATLFFMLTGRNPPESVVREENDITKLLQKKNISRGTISLVENAMAISYKSRIQTTEEFLLKIHTNEGSPTIPLLNPRINRLSKEISVADSFFNWGDYDKALYLYEKIMLDNPSQEQSEEIYNKIKECNTNINKSNITYSFVIIILIIITAFLLFYIFFV